MWRGHVPYFSAKSASIRSRIDCSPLAPSQFSSPYHQARTWPRRSIKSVHTKAVSFWEWCIRESIGEKYPETIFLAEAFTRPHAMYGLAKRGFTQSYTYFTWRNYKAEIEQYLEEITRPPVSDFFRPTSGRIRRTFCTRRSRTEESLLSNFGLSWPERSLPIAASMVPRTNCARTSPLCLRRAEPNQKSTWTARNMRFASGTAMRPARLFLSLPD